MTVIKRAAVTEADVQNAVAHHFGRLRHEMTVPNCGSVFNWEADVISVNKQGLAHEVEIKASRADWLVELRAANAEAPTLCPQKSPVKWIRHLRLRNGVNCPSYFWVAAPDGVVLDGELLDYCGFLNYGVTGLISVVKKAPRIHANPITDKQWRAMARGLSIRYWKARRTA